ncbi:TRAP transporter small permease subunit [Desulfospira joergensenii]|uniref:TRAP transporter small permease subunit n=1 Tax=Desulfospira joergensenii TaxID=53329 RepID=UPI0003B47F79|nr:TRAP transporter small permease subunit [Desulfospira joergensenii]
MSNNSESASPGTGPAPFADKMVKVLDSISSFFGKAVAILVLPMMYALVHEVVARYFFNAPTIWAGDVALILYGIFFMIASPYCLKTGMHIRTDFLYSRWSVKARGRVDFFTYLFLYFPTHFIFLQVGWKYFFKSFLQNEVIISSPWMPIIWPMKLAIPLSVFLMILQGISESTKSYYAWRHGQFYWDDGGGHHSADEPANACDGSSLID